MEYYCPYCDEESELETDGYEILDGDCPNCGRSINYEEVSRDWISSMVDRARDIAKDRG